ncbi:MAG TPA: antibiotic biosynthesis monooxygenase [Chloroflexota bacterium]|nr:antibiotic biosynthesis monooxygenase [Chloroflexota bacterium]
MSVTAVVRRRARRGEGPRLVALATHLLEERVTQAEPLSIARVFQSLSSPDDVLVVSVWDSREAYWARVRADSAQQQLDALAVGEPERHFFRRLTLDAVPGPPVKVVDCAILRCPPANVAALVTDLQQRLRPIPEVAPGFVLRYLGQDEDDPTRLLLFRGWDSLEALEEFRIYAAPRFEAEWAKHGATVERFVGHLRAVVESPSHHTP